MHRRTFISTTVGRRLVAPFAVEARVSARCTPSGLTSLINPDAPQTGCTPFNRAVTLQQQGASYGYARNGNANNG